MFIINAIITAIERRNSDEELMIMTQKIPTVQLNTIRNNASQHDLNEKFSSK